MIHKRKRVLSQLFNPVMVRVFTYLKPDRGLLLLGVLCAFGVSGTQAMAVLLLKPFVDSTTGAIIHASTQSIFQKIDLISVQVVGLYGLRWFFSYGQTVCFAEAGQRLSLNVRNHIYRHLQRLSLGFFNQQRTGGLMSTINNDVPILQSAVTTLKDCAPAPFLVLIGCYNIFRISPNLSLIALVAIPVMGYSINRLSRLIRENTSRTQDKLADVNTLMEESLSGVRIIQSFSAEDIVIDRFRRENQSAKDLSMQVIRSSARLKPTTDLIGAVGIGFALWIAGRMVATHQMTFGDLATFIIMLNLIANGIGGLGSAKTNYEQIQAAAQRIFKNVLDVEPEICDPAHAIELPHLEGSVEFRHVDFAYNPNTPVLRNLSFKMNPGEVIAVVGLSGSGKSTIADLIPRFYDPQAGHILVDGHDIRTVSLESLRRQIGIVPQETILFGGTIRDNIAYGRPDATDAAIEAAAHAANAHQFVANKNILPNGYNTIVGERGKQLSGGQRQRIAIARALLKDPRILILDEATSALDSESERLVQDALEKLMQGRTTLMIAHRLSTIQNANKILVLQEGCIVESGVHDELLKCGGFYAQLYNTRSFAENPGSVVASDTSFVTLPAQ